MARILSADSMVEDEAGSHLPIACARKILARLQFCSVRAGTVTIQAIWRAQLASLLEIHRLFFYQIIVSQPSFGERPLVSKLLEEGAPLSLPGLH
jgi:hypothetical protein